jgi:hypothetical protein
LSVFVSTRTGVHLSFSVQPREGSHDKTESEQTDIILTKNLSVGAQDSRTETNKPFSPKLGVFKNRIWSFLLCTAKGRVRQTESEQNIVF